MATELEIQFVFLITSYRLPSSPLGLVTLRTGIDCCHNICVQCCKIVGFMLEHSLVTLKTEN